MARESKSLSAYINTKVSVGQSQEHIRNLFRKHKIVGCQFSEMWDEKTGKTTHLELRFLRDVDGEKRTVKIVVPVLSSAKRTYRILYWWLKSMLEAVEVGLVQFEEAFLTHFEWMLDDGSVSTVGEIVLSKLGRSGHDRLLPEPGGDVVDGEFTES